MKRNNNRGGSHLDQSDRDRIAILKEEGYLQKDIAVVIGCDPGTVSRELKNRKTKGAYDPKRAQEKYRNNRRFSKRQGMKVQQNKPLRAHIIVELKNNRSPDEIAGRMKREKKPFYASREAIYKWIYSVWGQRYRIYLCTQRPERRRRRKKRRERVMIPERVPLQSRPLGATNKTRFGHWEDDTAVTPKRFGSKDAVSIGAERKSNLIVGTKLRNLKPIVMKNGVRRMHQGVKTLSASLDNGQENRRHQEWGMPTYFADPHAPWQKPHVENNIGLLRRWFFPKKMTNWANVTERQLQQAIAILNNKYRKSLNYKSALEVALEHGIIE
jgi:transposase, IS30 family